MYIPFIWKIAVTCAGFSTGCNRRITEWKGINKKLSSVIYHVRVYVFEQKIGSND